MDIISMDGSDKHKPDDEESSKDLRGFLRV